MRVFKSFRYFELVLCVVAFAARALPAQAKDLSARLGVGFINEHSNHVPALSAKYGISKDMQLGGALGFDTSDPSDVLFAGKFFKNIFYETNLNFYSAAGLAYLKQGEKSGVEVLGVLGAEFFIPGVDSLGFSFEAGASGTNLSGTFTLKTIGFTFLNAGMHFYF